MKPELLALYGGPDQIMGIASGIATLVGALLVFWNKLLVACGKVASRLGFSQTPEEPHDPQ